MTEMTPAEEAELSLELGFEGFFCKFNKIDHEKASSLVDEALEAQTSNDKNAKGKKLEKAVDYLLKNCGFLTQVSNTLKNRKYQLDHSAEFSRHIFQEYMEKHLQEATLRLVGESKNYKKEKLNVDKVYKLVGIMQLIKSNFGIFFTLEGLKGTELSSAKGLISDFNIHFKSIVIVFTKEDFQFLKEFPKLFGVLFYKKLSIFGFTKCSILSEDDYKEIKEYPLYY